MPKALSSLIISVLIAVQPIILCLKLWNLLRSLTRGSIAGALGLCPSWIHVCACANTLVCAAASYTFPWSNPVLSRQYRSIGISSTAPSRVSSLHSPPLSLPGAVLERTKMRSAHRWGGYQDRMGGSLRRPDPSVTL